MAALAAESALLGAAERRRWIGYQPAIESDHAGVDALRDAQAFGEVLGVDVRYQSVFGLVRKFNSFVDAGKRDDRRDGSEDFFVKDPRIRRDVREYGRRKIEPRPIDGASA